MKYIAQVFVFLFVFLSFDATSKGIYEIKVKIDNYQYDTLLMAYYYGDKQLIKDTMAINANGEFVFSGEENLDCGVYLMVTYDQKKYFQFLVPEGNEKMSFHTDTLDFVVNMKVKGSKMNNDFYGYMNFLNQQRPIADSLHQLKKDKGNPINDEIDKELTKLNERVENKQKMVIEKNKDNLLGALIKAGREIETPEFKDEKDRYFYYKAHYFDNIDFDDPCVIRTPFLFHRVDRYIEKLTPQHPDSINKSLDLILHNFKGNEDAYKFFLSAFLNKYAASKIVGQDACYVHMVENYYATGEADWVEEEQLKKIIDNGAKLKPLLIDSIAPDISVPELDIEGTIRNKDNESEYKRFAVKGKRSLYDMDGEFNLLFIWSPNCGHCKKAMPVLEEFYEEYKSKGVKIYAICHQNYKKTIDCAEYIKGRPGMVEWLHLTDPYMKSKYHEIYDVKSTPVIFLLDKNHKILSKKIGVDQLGDIIDFHLNKKK